MEITNEEIEHIAKLAHIQITEKEKFITQINNIIKHINKINEVDTGNIEPLFYVLPIHNALREDIVKTQNIEIEKFGNQIEKRYFRIPPIL
jgi:aspartyl-tRNA(Asn)/glutamyl-tRNA(Gln) amidotransferase subunit C